MKEKEPLVTGDNLGRDEASAKSLLQSHEKVENEIRAYNSEIERLTELSWKVIEGESAAPAYDHLGAISPVEDDVMEEEEVKVEVEKEELQAREMEHDVVTEVTVPQVKTLFRYQGQGMGFEKGELFFIVSKTNIDCWCVRRQNGQEGLVPANYMKETAPAKIKKVITKKEVMNVPVKVKRKRTEKRKVAKKGSISRRGTLGRRGIPGSGMFSPLKSDSHNVASRQQAIRTAYEKLLQATEVRELSTESLRLSGSYPGANASVITSNMEQVQGAWESSQAASGARKKKLRASSELQKFLSSVCDLVSWMHDMGALLLTDEPARSASEAEALLAKHNEHKAEIDTCEDSVA